MNNGKAKIKSFVDLNAWKEFHSLVLKTYKTTNSFPKTEQFGLTNQIRRASVSITSNIAEGFSRSSYKDKAHFYSMALGSTTEVQSQIMIARDLNYISLEEFVDFENQIIVVHKLLNGLIKSSNTIIHNT